MVPGGAGPRTIEESSASTDSSIAIIPRAVTPGVNASVKTWEGCGASRYRLNKQRSSSDSDCERSKSRPSQRSSGCQEPEEAKPADSSPAEAGPCVPRRRHRSKRCHACRLLASSAWLLRDRFAGSELAQPHREDPGSRCDRVCQNDGGAQRWRGKGCRNRRREPSGRAYSCAHRRLPSYLILNLGCRARAARSGWEF